MIFLMVRALYLRIIEEVYGQVCKVRKKNTVPNSESYRESF